MERHAVNILLGMSAALVLFGMFFASLGFLSVDEAIYVFAADTFQTSRSLILENGYDFYPSSDFQWAELLTVGPNGLTSQYPPGTVYLWALPLTVFGERGPLMLNVLATAGTLFVTRAIALKLFDDERLAFGAAMLFLFGTFSVEYAYVYWPHMLAVLAVSGGFLVFLHGLDRERGAMNAAMVSGAIIGAGILFRIDTILVLPAIAILTALYAAQPIRLAAGGIIGLAPALVLLSLANNAKFGSFNPISYGGKSGNTNLAAYVPFIAIIALLLVGLYALRFRGRLKIRRGWIALGLVVAAFAVMTVPAARSSIMSVGKGVIALVVDARTISSVYTDVRDMPDGTRMFWGLSKKALGQSMPWIGVLAMLAGGAVWSRHRKALVYLSVLIGVWSIPFLMRSWHGGMGSNMRYFLPLFPFIGALGALLLRELFRRAGAGGRPFFYAVLGGFGVAVAWTLYHPTGLAGTHQILSLYVFLAVTAVSLAAGLVRAAPVALAALAFTGIGVGVAGFNTFTDTLVSQLRRQVNRPLSDLTQVIPGKVVVYDYLFRSAMMNPDQFVAARQFGVGGPDPDLVRHALDNGYRVLMPEVAATAFVEDHPQYRSGGMIDEPFPMMEIVMGTD